MAEFRQNLFGCFGDFKVCIITFFAPCYTEGKIAEKVNESCLFHGLIMLVPIANIVYAVKIRQKVREQKGIAGSTGNDVFTILCWPEYALCQEAVEVNALEGDMVRQ